MYNVSATLSQYSPFGNVPQSFQNQTKASTLAQAIDPYLLLLSPVANLLEKIVLPYIQELLQSSFKHGFKYKHSTPTALQNIN